MLRLAALAALMFLTGAAHCEPLPTIALTFDHYRSTYSVAFPIMKRHGLVGTFFVDPQLLDTKDGPTSDEVREMERAGWEIGAYSGFPLDRYLAQGDEAARKFIAGLYFKMLVKGFAVKSIAPSGRLWSEKLDRMAAPYFVNVRLNNGRNSLSVADTADALRAAVDEMIAAGGLQMIVVHQVGNDNEPNFSVSATAFDALCAAVAGARDAGRLRATTFSGGVR